MQSTIHLISNESDYNIIKSRSLLNLSTSLITVAKQFPCV